MRQWEGMEHPTRVLTPKKSFGQHFLVQRSAIEGIVGAALASPAERLLEIGPGPGVLTERLVQDGRPLWAVELDPEACELMAARFGSLPHFRMLPGDAVQVPLPEGPAWSVVGNLPYNAATAILTRFLVQPIPWERMVLMFQLEVGQKLLGKPGEKNYGPLSILAQLTTRMTRLMKLGPGAFRPAPKVDSIVLLFEPRPGAPGHAQRLELLAWLHRSFAHRRKTLANNWQPWLETSDITAILGTQDLAPSIRAEAIPPAAWPAILSAVLSARTHDPNHDPL
jgi:16S rRNA (adenine1518-N6/adenine1519-N6)-dimethyltransferase